ncbi:T9SS type A sorting domain-containing protein [Halpernia frigidisoli]|uniref:Por secretion system C-terminal sorting domain-containing protein n=1 Tax=Halpernia frigidisoli TaxID=1125876 RepID=A0A1I3I2M6_9FLAO|nr:T9SS type A sorting domain-containing protein [Halpernia frigidisoli]SFI42224.1 Por secretion system C-terminal sorting domain-containing protein [Halpernia frigidisoli]
MKKKILLLLFPVMGICAINAQTSEITAGGNLTGSGGSASYAFGNVFYQPQSGSGGSTISGTQIPFEITSTLGIENDFINLQMSVFPNPVTDKLNLKIDAKNLQNYSYELFDAKGSKIQSKKTLSADSSVEMSSYPAGLYIFSVKENGTIIKTYKIIKK